ncbi:hypothetical protein [Bacillus velezensis]|uniref:hypothetical protein n=1 Tax=Bacillus velezensis TaxID=492670 RepID=UPI0002A11A52|nr:hypothetical protein [Bacillus velezensis]AFZ90236.1 hypothetical protein B938_06050 [Bacillus velezensis AS43.3]
MPENRNTKGQFIKGKGISDLTGKKFGRLRVIKLSEKRSGRKTFWDCVCDCGNTKTVRSDSLKSSIRSCGCLKKEQDKINLTKNHRHKQSGKHLYIVWMNMKQRCYNKSDKAYERYGGRGIYVCDEWKKSFDSFKKWSLDNSYCNNLSIERIDVNKGYSPDNCTWIPMKEQAVNRRSTVWVEYQGERLNLKQWSEKLGINYGTLHSRYYRSGMRPPELFNPVKTTPR